MCVCVCVCMCVSVCVISMYMCKLMRVQGGVYHYIQMKFAVVEASVYVHNVL